MRIEISATDDRASADELGYEVTIIGGEGPVAFDPSRNGRLIAFGEQLVFFFDVESSGFSVDLEIRAVDGNGNLGDPIVITVNDVTPEEGSSGCVVGRSGSLAGFGLLALATAFAMRRRRR